MCEYTGIYTVNCTPELDRSPIMEYNKGMVRRQGIEWDDSADRHGYTLEDVTYAARHITGQRTYELDGETYVRYTGLHHGDLLVPSIEVIMKMMGDGTILVFHVNAEQSGFLDRE